MARITFKSNTSASSTVNNLLDSVLPGHSSSAGLKKFTSITSTSQIINASSTKKNLKPEDIRRLKKKERLTQRSLIKKQSSKQDALYEKARYELLISHSNSNTLTESEKKELKRLISKNVVNLQSWRADIDEDLEDIQSSILELKNQGVHVKSKKKRTINKKVSEKELYDKRKKSQENRYPGLTPGLAPVDLEDSDSDDY
jgi:hypothetical protein